MTRTIKSVSFSKQDEYEVDLLEFALSESKYFGRYVKRLIADHRERMKSGHEDLLVVSPTNKPRDVMDPQPTPYNRKNENKAETTEPKKITKGVISSKVDINDFI